MPAPRPQSYVALALATLAISLATWWAFDSLSGLDPQADGQSPVASILPGDEYPPADPPAAKPAMVEVDPPPPPVLDGGRPPLNPNKPVLPEAVKPLAAEPPEDQPDGPPLEAEPREDEKPEAADFHTGAAGTQLIGGVGRPNARASQEILVPAGHAWIGTPLRWVLGLQGQRSGSGYVALTMEAPRHRVDEIEAFWIDRYEVSNHRYWEFLRDTASVLYRTSDHPPRSIVQVTETLILDPPRNLDLVNVTGKQLFLSNSAAILQAFKSMLVRNEDKTVDLDATYERIKDRALPVGLDIRFYDRAPPGTWPDSRYADGEIDHPVRDTAVEEAIAFALHHGRHIPTEVQWEYVARGANGFEWPWGNDGAQFETNVNGGMPREINVEPRTVPVFQFAAGRSPAGAWQMLGNVSEWTSSFLDPYPGGRRALPGAPEREVVVRGGSARDQDRYLVRPAFRGWHADDPDGAPSISQRRAWTGFRTARFKDPSQSRLPTMHFRARKGRRLAAAALEKTIFAGVSGHHVERFQTIVGEAEDRARRKPRPGIKALVVQPFQVICTLQRGRWAPNRAEALSDIGRLHGLAAPVLYGLVHTDLHLVGTWHSAEEPFNVFNPPTRLRREDVAPGTYLLGSVQGHLALLKTDLTDVWFVSNRPSPAATFNVVDQAYGTRTRRPRVERFKLRGLERLEFEFFVPMHATAEPGRAARLVMRLTVDERESRTLLGIETRQETK